jgi:predicted nucleotidyltransferase
MNAFLTGSRVYGTPREDSDIDLAVLMSSAELGALLRLADPEAQGHEYEDGVSIRFGNLNLIVFCAKDEFDAWRSATQELIARKPVTRAEAVLAIDAKLAEIPSRECVEAFPPYDAF